ncbi:MAG: CoA-transferase [SAR202 cluster bacterium]|nr:CoA-transferase [SAR202 cluster bacterium]MDP6302397.1 CoA-transferase [SAR202 cluster bacterium]MDP7102627.1 CoA-transferase [SAR202 cluster bacterium]MDP7224407.1 CoA-transferase [SAR202 cluster bacterium]MDP7413173.1 CoA-transferase [SAR202 cluster bacterium]
MVSDPNNKSISLAEAARLVEDGSTICLAGRTGRANHPMAFAYELARQKVKNLTVIAVNNGLSIDLLCGAGCVSRVESSCVGLEEFGLASNFRLGVESGEIEVREYPEDLITPRFYAASHGMPFYPVQGLFGTDILRVNEDIVEGSSPISGKPFSALPPAKPDWVVMHAAVGDTRGNAVFFLGSGYSSLGELEATRTTRNNIITVERIVPHEQISKYIPTQFQRSYLPTIPEFRTRAIVEAPYGTHPSSSTGVTEADNEFIGMYAKAGRARLKGDPGAWNDFTDKYVYGCETHEDYLNLVGVGTLASLRDVGGALV